METREFLLAASESLQIHLDDICDSDIPSSYLATRLYAAKIISEAVYKKVTDDQTRSENYTRIQEIMKAVKAAIKLKNEHFDKFLEVLSKDIPIGKALADKLSTSYKGTPLPAPGVTQCLSTLSVQHRLQTSLAGQQQLTGILITKGLAHQTSIMIQSIIIYNFMISF